MAKKFLNKYAVMREIQKQLLYCFKKERGMWVETDAAIEKEMQSTGVLF